MKLLFFNGLPEKGFCLFSKPFINCISLVFKINFYVCIKRWKGKKWQLPSPCGYTIKQKWIIWKFKEFGWFFFYESVTQDLSLKLTKRHLSIQQDSWIGRWPKSTHQTGHRNFLLPQQRPKNQKLEFNMSIFNVSIQWNVITQAAPGEPRGHKGKEQEFCLVHTGKASAWG